MSPGKDETRVCGYVDIYIHVYIYIYIYIYILIYIDQKRRILLYVATQSFMFNSIIKPAK